MDQIPDAQPAEPARLALAHRAVRETHLVSLQVEDPLLHRVPDDHPLDVHRPSLADPMSSVDGLVLCALSVSS